MANSNNPMPALVGRRDECATLGELLDAVRAGESRVLVVRGEAGIGKTALLRHLNDRAEGFRVLRATGVESEMELPFAGLHQLCAPVLDRIDDLPAPQRDALSTALGLADGDPPDRFRVGLGVLGLLSGASAEQPVLCVVDDSQWLDQASLKTLGFVARRAGAGRVGLVFGVREGLEDAELRYHPEMKVEGLDDANARELLAAAVTGRIDERVRDRIVAETRGNPLALLELPRGLTSAQLAGGFGLSGALPLESRLEQSFARRLTPLPDDSRLLLLIAAVEPVGDPVLVWRAAELLGIGADAAGPAVGAGLIEFGTRVRFYHPLVRSAVYRAGSVEQRRSVHNALAEVTDPERDPDRRVWHRAEAATGPDEQIADELEGSADRAQSRGGLAAAAAFLERATALTVDPQSRTRRALEAADAKYQSGASSDALELLGIVDGGPADELQRARADLIRARISFLVDRSPDAVTAGVAATRRLGRIDETRAREAYVDALAAGAFATVREARADAARAFLELPVPAEPRAAELLLIGGAQLLTKGYPHGTDLMKDALRQFRTEELSRDDEIRLLGMACRTAMSLWDDESWHALSDRYLELTRDAGLLSALPMALEVRSQIDAFSGELARAAELMEQSNTVAAATGSDMLWDGPTLLAAWREEEATALEQLVAIAAEGARRREDELISFAEYGKAIVNNALGRYDAAIRAAQLSCDYDHPGGGFGWVLVELAEAAARGGRRDLARETRDRIAPRTALGGTDWALGVQARVEALLSDGEQADELYREAIARLGRSRARTDLGRAHLLYGEWLRRNRRRADARRELRAAQALFTQMGAPVFSERAARELLATGETARKRVDQTRDELTAQEAQIARLARDGLSNPEIGGRLFISPRTVEYHLHKVFGKLGISSRSQLAAVLADDDDVAGAV
jgi:DNA-binding CsgD family transcriptional regulator